jgi:hypothetical protein
MKSLMRVQQCAFVIFAFFCCPGILTTAHGFSGEKEVNVYALGEQFTWLEFDESGARLLKESGTRYGVGGTYYYEFQNHLTLKPRAEVLGGREAYDGQTQLGVPVQSKTQYIEVKLEGDLGLRFGLQQNASIEPFGGLGLRRWDKELESSMDIYGHYADGYIETWTTLYLRAGARGEISTWKRNRSCMPRQGSSTP